MQLTSNELFRMGGYCAVVGGLLRIVTSFIPATSVSVSLEMLYALIDASLLLGLIAIYFRYAERLGISGLIAFVIALLGLASILGPDTQFYGVDLYQLGAFLLLLGLSVLSVHWINQRLLTTAPFLWLASLIVGLFGVLLASTLCVMISGVLFGIAFVIAGLEVAGAYFNIDPRLEQRVSHSNS